jgi:hypothetical protein
MYGAGKLRLAVEEGTPSVGLPCVQPLHGYSHLPRSRSTSHGGLTSYSKTASCAPPHGHTCMMNAHLFYLTSFASISGIFLSSLPSLVCLPPLVIIYNISTSSNLYCVVVEISCFVYSSHGKCCDLHRYENK